MQKKKKEKWSKPRLRVLTRGNPEEDVLSNCKCVGAWISGPYWDDPGRNCSKDWTSCSSCESSS